MFWGIFDMDYFKKCPECGRYMTPHLRYSYGQAFAIYSYLCGYSEYTYEYRYDNKTIYTGTGSSDRTVDR